MYKYKKTSVYSATSGPCNFFCPLISLAQINTDTNRAVLRRLFSLGDINMTGSQHGQTALMLGVSHGRQKIVQLLVESGADLNIRDEDGSSAL